MKEIIETYTEIRMKIVICRPLFIYKKRNVADCQLKRKKRRKKLKLLTRNMKIINFRKYTHIITVFAFDTPRSSIRGCSSRP